ncbi:hypothetical protein L596_005630 [Steinernema carpocapsae]|uniref:Uncharacterized protein n=1 Tax=Steinernema carpocapsae TaxID=34508 RepID=A0A4U8UZM7_STECR|nr:hypothetical protein L596_005630 [Steinernema carpocapsae]
MNSIARLTELKAISKLTLHPFTYQSSTVVLEFLENLFKHRPKPVFDPSEQSEAKETLLSSVDVFKAAFTDLHGRMEVDLREEAQIARSGLQFLVDDFESNELLELLKSDPVLCLEEYLENTKDIEPWHVSTKKGNDSNVPKSHYWWFC